MCKLDIEKAYDHVIGPSYAWLWKRWLLVGSE